MTGTPFATVLHGVYDGGLDIPIATVGTNASAKTIHSFIAQLHGFASINGVIDFRDGGRRGLNATAALIVRYDKAAKTWVPVSRPGGAPL